MDATKLVLIAVGVIAVVIIVAAIFAIVNTGKETFNSNNDQLVDQLAGASTGKYDILDGAKQSGDGVIRVIDQTFAEREIEVLVCEKDGTNFVYNKRNLGATGNAYAVPLEELKSGVPTTDACGNQFIVSTASDGKITTKVIIQGAPAVLMCNNGYDSTAPVSTPGYIATTSSYTGSVQKDVNGNVRRITFIQN